MARRGGCLVVLAAVGLALWGGWGFVNRERGAAVAIPGALNQPAWFAQDFVPAPVEGSAEQHPFLAAATNATMHGNGWQSDTHLAAGPFGPGIAVRSRQAGNGMPRQCATYVYRSDGKPVAMCGGLTGFRMVLLDPATLTALAHYDLPMRPSAFQAIVKRDMSIMMNDTSGGAYMFLDNHDRLVFADSRMRVQRLVAREEGGRWRFEVEHEWDLRPHVPHDCLNWNNLFPSGPCDMVTTVMPDAQGHYWWTTRHGLVGTLDPESGAIRQIRLPDEEIQNALAMDNRAIYVLSDHAQYAFAAAPDGTIRQLWRTPYDRGSETKVGSIDRGSGTTPTLLGQDWITFTDNADGRINVEVLRRSDGGVVCKVPLFQDGASATDNSMIGWGNAIILENNAGYKSAHQQTDWSPIAGGISRVDVRPDGSGCDLKWTSPLKSPSVVGKLSAANGIAYYYSFTPAHDAKGRVTQDWAVVGLDARTGREVLRVPTGQGKRWDNNWSSLSIAPDGALYVGTTSGLVQVRGRSGVGTH